MSEFKTIDRKRYDCLSCKNMDKNKLNERGLTPEYDSHNKLLSSLDKIAMMVWPKESKRMIQLHDEMAGKDKRRSQKDAMLVEDEYYEIRDFLKESLEGSVSRYWVPFKRT